jgi:hypothetical protein
MSSLDFFIKNTFKNKLIQIKVIVIKSLYASSVHVKFIKYFISQIINNAIQATYIFIELNLFAKYITILDCNNQIKLIIIGDFEKIKAIEMENNEIEIAKNVYRKFRFVSSFFSLSSNLLNSTNRPAK